MALHWIYTGRIRTISAYYGGIDSDPSCVVIRIWRHRAGNCTWYARGKLAECLVPDRGVAFAPAEVLKVVEMVVSLGRRAYLRSLAGPLYREQNP